jgi:glucose/arabinose dehydrogenase
LGWLLLVCLVASPGGALAQGDAPTDTILLTRVATGLNRPVNINAPPGDRSRLFVVEKPGRIRIVTIQNGVYTLLATPFLDIDPLVGSSGNEQGLLSLAFHPDYASNGYFYVDYTDNSGNTVVARYRVSTGNPNVADPASASIVLTQNQPYSNHNGGQLQFGPDGYLYIAFGDGGSGGDPQQYAQNTTTWLGKILRIDVDSAAPYAVPASNPWAGSAVVRPEIWSLGLRNPWRFSFDRLTGDMWIGDVGQGTWEEVDLELAASPGGVNWGWRCYEGHAVYDSSPACPSPQQPAMTPPIYDYNQTGPTSPLCAITGGYVYRGSPNSTFFGGYVFVDYCNPYNQLWVLRPSGSGGWTRTDYTIVPPAGLALISPTTFGEDAIGDLYVADDTDGDIFKLNLRPAACVAGNYDVNGDGAVTVLDIFLVAGDWYRTDYIPDLDVTCDTVVDIVDVQLVAAAIKGG